LGIILSFHINSLFVSLVDYAESTVRWFVVREKHCWMAADSADKSKRTGRKILSHRVSINMHQWLSFFLPVVPTFIFQQPWLPKQAQVPPSHPPLV
jgi:hypothetical protein